jgi:hypothetical protein
VIAAPIFEAFLNFMPNASLLASRTAALSSNKNKATCSPRSAGAIAYCREHNFSERSTSLFVHGLYVHRDIGSSLGGAGSLPGTPSLALHLGLQRLEDARNLQRIDLMSRNPHIIVQEEIRNRLD